MTCMAVWDAICTLAESESVMYNAYLGLALQVLNLLLQIPIDISFHMQIPLTITYCLESSVHRKWCPEQGGILPLHKEIRVSCTLSKVLGGVTHQPSESAGRPPLLLLWTTPWVPVGHRALDIELIAIGEASPLRAANDQALGVLWVVTTPFIPKPPKMAMSLVVSLLPPKVREAVLKKRMTPKRVRVRLRPQVMNSNHPRVKTSRSTHTPRTPSPVLVSSGEHENTNPKSDSGEKVQTTQQRQHKNSPKEDSPKKDSSELSSSEEEPPTDEVLCDEARQKVQLLDTCFNAWHHNKITNNVMG